MVLGAEFEGGSTHSPIAQAFDGSSAEDVGGRIRGSGQGCPPGHSSHEGMAACACSIRSSRRRTMARSRPPIGGTTPSRACAKLSRLRRDEVDLDRARLWVRRLKGGLSVEQPIAGDELRAIKRHLAARTDALPWLFLSERGQPMTRQAVNYLVAAAGLRAGLPGLHPHTLRHSCGYALADKGQDLRLIQDYLGHRDPRHTVHYTRTAGRRFEGLWR